MSISFAEGGRTTRGVRTALGVLFVALLALSVVWPAPVVDFNSRFIGAPIAVDERSFLGREAPSWDAVFWALAGLYVLVLFHGRIGVWSSSWEQLRRLVREVPSRIARQARATRGIGFAGFSVVTAALTALVWFLVDSPAIAAAEGLQNVWTRDAVRFLNRFGGGMNPPLVVGFFFFCGMLFPRARWVALSLAMALSSLTGGLVVHLLKYFVGRSRPEVWLGPFHHAGFPSNSFPSGHTVGAFAIAGAILFGVKSKTLKVVSILLAFLVGVSRVFAFRHWPSDVLTSSLIGLFFGWFFARALAEENE